LGQQFPDQGDGFGLAPEAGPEHQHIARLEQLQDAAGGSRAETPVVAARQRFHHQLGDVARRHGGQRGRHGDGHQAGATAERRQSGQLHGAGLAAPAAHHQDVAEVALVGVLLAREEEAAHIIGRQQIQGVFRNIEQEIRRADGHRVQIPRVDAGVAQDQARFGRGEGHGEVGEHRGLHRAVFVGEQAGGQVHGHHRRRRIVDGADDIGLEPIRRLAEPGAEERVHDEMERLQVLAERFQAVRRGDIRDGDVPVIPDDLQVDPGVARDPVGAADDVDVGGDPAQEQVPGNHEAVAAVVAPAADHADVERVEFFELLLQDLHDGNAGVFHEGGAGDADLRHGAAIHFTHLRGCQQFHMLTFRRLV